MSVRSFLLNSRGLTLLALHVTSKCANILVGPGLLPIITAIVFGIGDIKPQIELAIGQ